MTTATKRRPAAPMQSPPEPVSSSAALRDLLERKRAELADATQHRDALVASMGDVDNDGDDAAKRNHHQACTLADERVRGLSAGCATLEQRIVEAEALEHRANVEAAYRRRLELDAEGLAIMADIEGLGRQLAAKLTRLDGCQRESEPLDRVIDAGGLHERLAEELGDRVNGPAWTQGYGVLTARGVFEIPSTMSNRALWGRSGYDAPQPRPEPAPAAPGDGRRGPRVIDVATGRDVGNDRWRVPAGPVGVAAAIARIDRAHGW